MVFCRSHSDVTELSTALSVAGFTARDVSTNANTMQDWRSGRQVVMISTSILGCGLDYPHVRHVIHNDTAYTMIDQHQQESRAGRDGKRALAITYTTASSLRARAQSGSYGAAELGTWAASTKQCLRVIPSSYIDGVPITCSLLPRCELCSYCEEQLQNSPPTQATSLRQFITDPVVGMEPPAKATNAFGGPLLNVFVPPPTASVDLPAVVTPASMGQPRYVVSRLYHTVA